MLHRNMLYICYIISMVRSFCLLVIHRDFNLIYLLIYLLYLQVGTKDRYNISDDTFKALNILRFMTFVAMGLSTLRLIVAFIMLVSAIK